MTLWITLLVVVAAKVAIAVDHRGELQDLTTGAAKDDLHVDDQESHTSLNDGEHSDSSGSSGQMEVRGPVEEPMDTTMNASFFDKQNAQCDQVVPKHDDGAQFSGWANTPRVEILGASNLWDSPGVKKLYGHVGQEILNWKAKDDKRGEEAKMIQLTMIITAKRVTAFGEVAAWYDEEKDVVDAIFGKEANYGTTSKGAHLGSTDEQKLAAEQLVRDWTAQEKKFHSEPRSLDEFSAFRAKRKETLHNSKLPIRFNYVDIHGEYRTFPTNDETCFAEPLAASGPCEFGSLHETDIVHVLGGNTFYLQEMVQRHARSSAGANIDHIKKWAQSSKERGGYTNGHKLQGSQTKQSTRPGLLFGQSAGMIFIYDKDAAGALMKAMSEDAMAGDVPADLESDDSGGFHKICIKKERKFSLTVDANGVAKEIKWQDGNKIGGDIDGYLKFKIHQKYGEAAKESPGKPKIIDQSPSEPICLPPVTPNPKRHDIFLNAIPKIQGVNRGSIEKTHPFIASVPHMDPELVCKVGLNMRLTGYEAALATANRDGYIHIAGNLMEKMQANGGSYYVVNMHNSYLEDLAGHASGNTNCVQKKLEDVYKLKELQEAWDRTTLLTKQQMIDLEARKWKRPVFPVPVCSSISSIPGDLSPTADQLTPPPSKSAKKRRASIARQAAAQAAALAKMTPTKTPPKKGRK